MADRRPCSGRSPRSFAATDDRPPGRGDADPRPTRPTRLTTRSCVGTSLPTSPSDGRALSRTTMPLPCHTVNVNHAGRTLRMPEYLTTQEVGELVRAPTESVRFWRHVGKGPRSFKLGRRVLY